MRGLRIAAAAVCVAILAAALLIILFRHKEEPKDSRLLSVEQAIENIRNQAGISGYFDDSEARDMIRDACSSMRRSGVEAIMDYAALDKGVIIVLQNAAASSCPEFMDDVQKWVEAH